MGPPRERAIHSPPPPSRYPLTLPFIVRSTANSVQQGSRRWPIRGKGSGSPVGSRAPPRPAQRRLAFAGLDDGQARLVGFGGFPGLGDVGSLAAHHSLVWHLCQTALSSVTRDNLTGQALLTRPDPLTSRFEPSPAPAPPFGSWLVVTVGINPGTSPGRSPPGAHKGGHSRQRRVLCPTH